MTNQRIFDILDQASVPAPRRRAAANAIGELIAERDKLWMDKVHLSARLVLYTNKPEVLQVCMSKLAEIDEALGLTDA